MIYKNYLKMHIKSSMQYRANMLMLSFSSCIVSIGELLSIFLMFQNFKSVGNWGFYESALMFGLITTIYSITECFARGFDEFANIIRQGDLDRILVRPLGIIHQLFGTKIELSKLMRSAFGLFIIIFSLIKLNIEWSILKVLVLLATFSCGCLVIWGVMLVGAGISVFSIENLEFINVFTIYSLKIKIFTPKVIIL